MHLWKREGGWTFQKRVPSDLINCLGTTPIRLSLPPLKAREAQRQANLLAGMAEQSFAQLRRIGMPEGSDGRDWRDEVISDLRRQLEQQNGILLETRQALAATLKAREAEAATSAQLVKLLTDMKERLSTPGNHSQTIELPLLSAQLPKYLDKKRKELDPDGDGNDQVDYIIPAAFATFMEIIGDKPLHEYVASDLESFGTVLGRVPANKAKKKMLREMTFREAADYNSGLRKRYETLVETTIVRNYLSPVKTGFSWFFRDLKERSPFAEAEVKAPPKAKPAKRRDSLTKDEVNKLLQIAADQQRPEDRWMPLLAYLTGARLFELVQMQGRNIQRVDGQWIYDLRKDIVRKDSKIRKPKVKNEDSARPIVLHQVLVELGFVEWAKERKGFIFDQLHRAVDPGGTASKRMARLLAKAELKNSKVFHGQRHATKDWLRENNIHDRDINLLVGHAMASVAEEYGKKSLRTEDFKLLANVALPKELDLSKYKERRDQERMKAKSRRVRDRAHE